jgi:hypothetical protein
MKKLILILTAAAVALAATNPSEADFREHVRKKEGVAGTAAMVMMDLLSLDKKGGIHRDNYFVASRFYTGGEGLLPREELAWGVAGQIIETK